MKLLFENWKRYLNEEWGEGIHFTEGAQKHAKVEIARELNIDLSKITREGWDPYPRGPSSKKVQIVDGRDLHLAINDAVEAAGYPLGDQATAFLSDLVAAIRSEKETLNK
tara:strand:- start:461 stop:790 length:330 start_codon:yes stop_codon:yes gene_type:complete